MKQKKRFVLLVLLVLVCLALLMTGTYAAYTNTKYVKRVVTTGISDGAEPFSSNYLYKHSSDSYYIHTIKVPETGSTPIQLVIYNYPPMNSTRFSSHDITYTLTAAVVDKDGNSTEKTAPTITPSEDVHQPTSGRYQLDGGKISTNVFFIDFANSDVETFKNHRIRIEAVSENPAVTLAAEFELVSASATDAKWKGQIIDTESPEVLDAFNYEVSGTAEGTITLSWEADIVALSHWSREDLAPNSAGNSISFDVGGIGNPTSYLVQFYRINAPVKGEGFPKIDFNFKEKTPEPATP